MSPSDAGVIPCHQHYHLHFLISFSHFFLGMTEFLILSAVSFWHYGTVCKLLGEKHCHDKGSQLPASALAWAVGSADISFQVSLLLKCPFCTKNIADPFFCDAAPA